MSVTLAGDAKPIKPFTVYELAERLGDQNALYDGVSIFLQQRGSQPLETSMFAKAKPAGHPTGRFARKSAGKYTGKPVAGRFVKNQPLKNRNEDGKYYGNIAQGTKDNAGRPFVASARIDAERNASKMFGRTMNPAAVKSLDAPKILGESKSTGAKNLNETKAYNGPQDFDIVKEIAARVFAQSNDHKIITELKSLDANKRLGASAYAPQIPGEPMSFTTPKSPSGVNPKAQAFVPTARLAGNSNPGLTNNEDWLAHARDFVSKGGLASILGGPSTATRAPPVKPREIPARVLLFKNVPDWLTLSDAIGFVYGGAIDCVFRSEMAEITVQFCDEAACEAYLEAYPNGIKVANPGNPDQEVTINVEQARRGQVIAPGLQVKISSGGSRLVRVDGMLDAANLQALMARAMEYEVDHLEFRNEKNKIGSAYFFFCGLVDGWSFRQQLKQDEQWADYTAEFMADPCQVATSFHGNAITNRMASAVAAA